MKVQILLLTENRRKVLVTHSMATTDCFFKACVSSISSQLMRTTAEL
uniref:Uncharacterized protein n=1 Tax=Arundo donax TaxID=35708 RepID=A0A0A9A1B1_ARUDO